MPSLAHPFRGTLTPLVIQGPCVLQGLTIEPSAGVNVTNLYTGLAVDAGSLIATFNFTGTDTVAAPLPENVSYPEGLTVDFPTNVAAVTAFIAYPDET